MPAKFSNYRNLTERGNPAQNPTHQPRVSVSVNWCRELDEHAGQPPKQEAKSPNLAAGNNPAVNRSPARVTASVNRWRPLCNHPAQPPVVEAKNPWGVRGSRGDQSYDPGGVNVRSHW